MSIAFLKILSGMHQDALVPIDHDRIIIGGSDAVDIVLGDNFLKDKSIVVDVGDKRYRLHSSSDQLDWSSATLNLSGHVLVFYKTSDLILGFSDDQAIFSQVNHDELVFMPYVEKPVDQDHQQEVAELLGTDKFTDSDHLNTDADKKIFPRDDDPENELEEDIVDEDGEEADVSTIFKNKKALSIGVVAIAATLFGLGYFSFYTDFDESVPIPTVACESQFKEMFSDAAYQQLRFTSEANTNLIKGYVNSYEDLRALKDKALSLPCAKIDRVYSNQQIVSSMQNILPQDLLDSVKVIPDKLYGHIIMEGYAKDEAQWRKLKSRILMDVNGLLSIIDKVETVQTHLTILHQMINKYQLDGYVHLKVIDDKIVADMVFNPSMYDKWKQMVVAYKDVYKTGPELVMDNVNITQLGIAGISQGRMAHIVLENGEKYVVGSVLPNGSVLSRVDDDGLVLSTVSGEIKYPISTLF